jgi:hypothetical protein
MINDPRRNNTNTMGNSQNFFRSLINAHSSRRNSPIHGSFSKLVRHMRSRAWMANDPIRGRIVGKSPAHGIPPKETHHQSHRRNQAEEDDAQKESGINPPDDVSEFHPDGMDRLQEPRKRSSESDESAAEADCP